MSKDRVTKEALIKSIEKNNGVYSYIANDLGICRQTVSSYIQRWNLLDFATGQKNNVKDKVRMNIYDWIDQGNEKVTLWFAERQMFDEYGQKQTIVNHNHNEDLRTNEQIIAENKRLTKSRK